MLGYAATQRATRKILGPNGRQNELAPVLAPVPALVLTPEPTPAPASVHDSNLSHQPARYAHNTDTTQPRLRMSTAHAR